MGTDFLGLLRALSAAGVEYVVVGGVAAILEGAPLATLDLDVVYRVEERNLERLAAALDRLGARYRDPAGRDLRPDAARLRTHRTNLLETDLGMLDALQRIGEEWLYEDVVARSEQVELDGLAIRVLGLAAVIESKRAAGRDKDSAALPLLVRTLEERRERDEQEGM